MVTNYYTLKALAEAWSKDLPGCIVGDVYSQSRDEMTLAFASPEKTWMLRASTNPAFQYIFRSEGYNKAKKNVAPLFPDALDKKVSNVSLADGDRVLFIHFDDQHSLQFSLYGPRANIYLLDQENIILDAFQRGEALKGTEAPLPKPAPDINTFEDFQARWHVDRKTTARAITSAFPFFNADLAKEVVQRAAPLPDKPKDCSSEDLNNIFETSVLLTKELLSATPRIYWNDRRAIQFSLSSLQQPEDIREESFDSIDKAVTIYIRRQLGQRAFDAVYIPLEKALAAAHKSYQKRLETMLTSLSEESRADKYERWGHLLMAAQADVPFHAKQVTLPDLFDESQEVNIPLEESLTAVENAQRYYDKARKTRQAREHAEGRLDITEQRTLQAEELLSKLHTMNTRAEVEKFEKAEAKQLALFLGHQTSSQPQIPFRRYPLAGGYEVWVGKNAKQNDNLTFQYARKFDFWLHARGVPGSHTVLRRPGRTAQPPKQVMEDAASIAAYHSKARGSHLVPVIITERKYVRKPKGAPVGTVIVEKEQVLIVEPALP